MIEDSNQKTYRTAQIVRYYAQLKTLQPAEQTILESLRSQLSTFKMLDIGVGGGRTSQHFAKIVADYTGIDYSAEMISACQKRFATTAQTIRFDLCDARDLSRFPDNSFDFILFSFNGIDYISHRDRLQVLQEVQRVGKPGGYFCFSTHNLQNFEREFCLNHQLRINPIATYTNLVMFSLLRFFNRNLTLEQIKQSAHALIKDESHNFQLRTYYIRPHSQIEQLSPYFSQVKIFSWSSGLELTNDTEIANNLDSWLYYQCLIADKSA
jgi:ubiquinone/menaquinone biosynthesis C-methylase UbiE